MQPLNAPPTDNDGNGLLHNCTSAAIRRLLPNRR